jgi:hypothetical protein
VHKRSTSVTHKLDKVTLLKRDINHTRLVDLRVCEKRISLYEFHSEFVFHQSIRLVSTKLTCSLPLFDSNLLRKLGLAMSRDTGHRPMRGDR